MGILFISHPSRNDDRAIRVRDWLREQGRRDTFLDLDPEYGLAPGQLARRAEEGRRALLGGDRAGLRDAQITKGAGYAAVPARRRAGTHVGHPRLPGRARLRSLALPTKVAQWSLSTLREKLAKVGDRIVRHGGPRGVSDEAGAAGGSTMRQDPPVEPRRPGGPDRAAGWGSATALTRDQPPDAVTSLASNASTRA